MKTQYEIRSVQKFVSFKEAAQHLKSLVSPEDIEFFEIKEVKDGD